MPLKIVSLLIAGLLPAFAVAIEFNVGIGLSDGNDNAAQQQEYARLRQDIRSLRLLEQNLDQLGREEPPAELQNEESGEWRQQSEWLLKQSEEVARLAGQAADYLQDFTQGSAAVELFDYQAAKFKNQQRLDAIEDAAKKYTIKGKEAIERQDRAIKLITRTY